MPTTKDSVWYHEPARAIGVVVSILGTLVAVISSAIADLPANATWLQVAFVLVAALVPLVQGQVTRGQVYSPATFEAAKKK